MMPTEGRDPPKGGRSPESSRRRAAADCAAGVTRRGPGPPHNGRLNLAFLRERFRHGVRKMPTSMILARSYSAGILGVDAYIVTVEAQVGLGSSGLGDRRSGDGGRCTKRGSGCGRR